MGIAGLSFYQVSKPQRSVVVYTSVDQVYSEPILRDYEKKTGIKVLAVYDVEATKTVGLVNRLIAEKGRPQADVFWNNEFLQTLQLKKEGVLDRYRSPAASDLPAQYIDPENYWTCFGGRARVLLVNTNLVPESDYPKSILDLLSSKIPAGQIGIAYPLFGTSLTHAAALYGALGRDQAKDFYLQLKSRGVRIVDGNSVVRDLVASGQLKVGLTDTDDALGAIRKKAPVAMIYPDQHDKQLGTLIIPNSVAFIANAPHPLEGQALIDYLVSKEVEEQLILSDSIQIPVRPIRVQPTYLPDGLIRNMNVSFTDIFNQLKPATDDLRKIFIQ